MNIFGLNPVVVFGDDAQRRRWLPPLIAGREKACFAVTEPDAGLDTTKLGTRAVRQGDEYVVHGRKIWISTAQVAHKMLLLARTTRCRRWTSPPGPVAVLYGPGPVRWKSGRSKMGRKAVDSNMLFIDGLRIPVADRVGEEGRASVHPARPEPGTHPDRGRGRGHRPRRLERAVRYAGERVVFGRPIGQNQGVQHPLAQAWMQLEAADLMVYKAASLYDAGKPCGPAANSAKYLAAEAGYNACQTAVMTLGGMGCQEYHVERLLRELHSAHRAGQPAADPVFHRGESAGTAQVLLSAARQGGPSGGVACRRRSPSGLPLQPGAGRRRMLAYSACLGSMR